MATESRHLLSGARLCTERSCVFILLVIAVVCHDDIGLVFKTSMIAVIR